MEANNHQGIQMELAQESLVKELDAAKRREAELRKDNKDLFVAVFRCKATEARVKTLEDAIKYQISHGFSADWLIRLQQALAAKEPKA